MKNELELTIKLEKPLEEVKELLRKSDFALDEISVLDDIYMKRKNQNYSSIKELLNDCVLIRMEGTHFSGFTLKKKEYNAFGDITKDEKLYLEVPNLKKGKLFLELLGFQELFHLKQDIYFYKRNHESLALQVIDDLGIFIEYEASNGETEEEIKSILDSIFGQTFSNYYEKKAISYIEKYHLLERRN